MRHLEYAAYLLAALTSGGGAVGYIMTGQVHSIVVGCGFGLLCISIHPTHYVFTPSAIWLTGDIDASGGYRIGRGQAQGVETCLAASILLGGPVIPRAILLRRPTPIFLSLLSVCGLVTFGNEYLMQWRQ